LSFYMSAFIGHFLSQGAADWFDTYFQVPLLFIYLLYVFVSFRRTYQTGSASAVLASIVMAGGFVVVNFYYRFVLFVVTYWSMS